jgi:hypothetical protein
MVCGQWAACAPDTAIAPTSRAVGAGTPAQKPVLRKIIVYPHLRSFETLQIPIYLVQIKGLRIKRAAYPL